MNEATTRQPPPQRLVIEMTEAQRRNTIEFLNRTPLKGAEAGAMLDLKRLLTAAKPAAEPNAAAQPGETDVTV
jgi:hypothetical protein